jgi:hypothetical protein
MKPGSSFRRTLRPVAAGSAAIGGALWIVKSLAILAFNEQPDHTFEMAPFFFALAVAGVVVEFGEPGTRSRSVRSGLGAVAVVAGTVSALTYVVYGDTDLFGASSLVTLLAVLLSLLSYGRSAEPSAAVPWLLGLSMIAAIPTGGALSAINERLLEVPLLFVGLGWLVLVATLLDRSLPDRWGFLPGRWAYESEKDATEA